VIQQWELPEKEKVVLIRLQVKTYLLMMFMHLTLIHMAGSQAAAITARVIRITSLLRIVRIISSRLLVRCFLANIVRQSLLSILSNSFNTSRSILS
jgi:hypothetical protein